MKRSAPEPDSDRALVDTVRTLASSAGRARNEDGHAIVRPRVLTEQQLREVCALIDPTLIRQCTRRSEGEPAKTPKRKVWRQKRPPEEECEELKRIEQNSPEWAKARELSSGASSLYTVCGWSGYKYNWNQWEEDTGRQVEKARSVKDCFPADNGHHYEDEARRVAAFFLGCEALITGIWIHPDYPFAHASPDSIDVYPERAEEIICLGILADALRGLMEIKCPIFSVHKAKGYRLPFPHQVPGMYVIQQLAQMSCTGMPWSDFVSFWRCNEWQGLQPVRPTPSEAPLPGQWKIAELMASRIYQNDKLARDIYGKLQEHMQHVANDTKPPTLDRYNFGGQKIKWLPLVSAVFVVTGCPGTLDPADGVVQSITDPDVILRFCSADPRTRPHDWVGEYPPRIKCEPRYYFNAQPVHLTLCEIDEL